MRKPDLMANKNKMNNIKSKFRKGLWSLDEDERLVKYMLTNVYKPVQHSLGTCVT